MTTHIIIENTVSNTIVATVEEAQAVYPEALCLDAEQYPGGIGWTWDGSGLVPPPAPPEPVPQSISRAQGKAALIQAGLWSAVVAYVDAMTDPTKKALAEVALNDTTEWLRTSPFLNAAATALELTETQLDDLFRTAATIQL